MCYSPMVSKALKDLSAEFGIAVDHDAFATYETLHTDDPKKFPEMVREQIFPGHYAPVVTLDSIQPMRYGAWPDPGIRDPGRYTTYNARMENISSPFWLACPELAPGIVKVKSFLEWVMVVDLIKDKKVDLAQIEKRFLEQIASRKVAVEKSGKKFSLTPTEKKSPLDRKVTIRIIPDNGDMYVPVLVSRNKIIENPLMVANGIDGGFAIITGSAPPEIHQAGHDRCPIHLDRIRAETWLRGNRLESQILKEQSQVRFLYQLAD